MTPSGNPRVLLVLQVARPEGSDPPFTKLRFQFEAEDGRDAVKELVAGLQLRQASGPAAAPRAAEGDGGQSTAAVVTAQRAERAERLKRRKLEALARNPTLKELHAELVMRGDMDDRDFWDAHSQELGRAGEMTAEVAGQALGVCSGLLERFQPLRNTNDNTKTQYQLTPDTIAQVYKTYPTLKREHDRLVAPNGPLTDSDFWRRVLESQVPPLCARAAGRALMPLSDLLPRRGGRWAGHGQPGRRGDDRRPAEP